MVLVVNLHLLVLYGDVIGFVLSIQECNLKHTALFIVNSFNVFLSDKYQSSF